MTVLSIDFETASQADLTQVGARLYAEHPSTRVLCMAYAFDNGPVSHWVPGAPFPADVAAHVAVGGTVRGWNVKFELEIWNRVLGRHTPRPSLRPEQLDDTMARAAFWGLPLSLDKAGVAMGISNLKSKTGHALMMRMCRPRAVDPATGVARWWHLEEPQMLDDLVAYCKQDVLAERELANKLPPLPDRERRIWLMDLEINQRGVPVDPELATRMRDIAAVAKKRLDRKINGLTEGRVKSTNQAVAILAEAQAYGFEGGDLRRDTLKEHLPRTESDYVRELLMIRQDAARTSTAKLNALLRAHDPNTCRVYGMLQHYGAIRTGRWAGRLLQPQNIPRPVIKNVDAAVAAIMQGATDDDLELLFSASTMGVLASCLRATIAAGPGKVLVSADLSQIEARVVAWLAGQLGILQVFASGQDPYVYTANQIGSNDRQLGKVMVLALGFGMGVAKFIETAKTYGIRLGFQEAEQIVNAWRAANQHIVQFWWDCDRAARQIALATQDMAITVNTLTFRRRGGSMIIELPSGRPLVYRGIRLIPSTSRPGQYDIAYYGLNQYTNRWELIRTYGGKVVENVTQAVARDVMADGLLDIDDYGLADLVLTVHDEAIAETEEARGQIVLDAMLACLTRKRAWTGGLPVDAAGWIGPRYKKG